MIFSHTLGVSRHCRDTLMFKSHDKVLYQLLNKDLWPVQFTVMRMCLYVFMVYKVWVEMWCLLQIPLENKSIFSGSLFQYLEENKKWRNRFLFVPDSYNINYYDSKAVRGEQYGLYSLFYMILVYSLSNMWTLLPVWSTSPTTDASIPKEPSTVPATECWHLWSNTWICSATAYLVRRRVVVEGGEGSRHWSCNLEWW